MMTTTVDLFREVFGALSFIADDTIVIQVSRIQSSLFLLYLKEAFLSGNRVTGSPGHRVNRVTVFYRVTGSPGHCKPIFRCAEHVEDRV